MYYPNTLRMRTLLAMMAFLAIVSISGTARAQRYVTMRPAATTQPVTYPVQPTQYRYQYAAQPATYAAQPTTYVQQAAYTQPVAAAATGGDAYGFTNWLNSVRAQYGLSPVGYDAGLENWASVNNAQQASRGMGHFVMGPARRQNCAMGSSASIGSQWMASPAHRAALLDPSITRIGLAGSGSYWTFNAY